MTRLRLFWLLALAALPGCNDRGVPPGYQGVVEYEERQLAFELSGRIDELAVARGQQVHAGDPIARLDDSLERPQRDARAAELAAARAQADLLRAGTRPEEMRQVGAQLKAARATVEQVEVNLGRQRRLATSGAAAIARTDDLEADLARANAEVQVLTHRLRVMRDGARPEEITAADARVAAAAAALDATDRRLERFTLRAPLDAAILDVILRPGELAVPGAPVVLVGDTAHPYVDAFVPQADVAPLRVGTAARVVVDGVPDGVAGVIEDVARTTEFTPRFLFSNKERPNLVIRVRVRIDDPDRRLHAGVPAFVTFAPSAP